MVQPTLATLFLVFLVAQTPWPANLSFTARVVGVHDGDTISVFDGTKQTKIRLEGVDCPEEGADFSQRAKQFTSDLVFGKDVQIIGKELDRYDRLVARVTVNERDTSLALVEAGLAWHYKYYSDDPVLAAGEIIARAKKLGVWSLPNPIPPWETRVGTQARSLLESSAAARYHGNSKSRVYHSPGCQHYTCANCTVQLSSKEEAARVGFRPHEQCVGSAAVAQSARPLMSSAPSSPSGANSSGTMYHGNQDSRVYHAPGCQHYSCKNCVVVLSSKEEAGQRGFRPHSQCVQ